MLGLLLCTVLLTTACGDEPVTAPDGPQRGVAHVQVTPDSTSLHAIGAGQDFEATALDAAGKPISGVTIEWSSEQSGVATVSSTGRATAEGDGNTTIRATARGATGSAELTVAASFPNVARVSAFELTDPTASNDSASTEVTVHAQ